MSKIDLEQTVATISKMMKREVPSPEGWSAVEKTHGTYFATKKINQDQRIDLFFFPIRSVLMFAYYDEETGDSAYYSFTSDGTIITSSYIESPESTQEKLAFYPPEKAVEAIGELAQALNQALNNQDEGKEQ